jgi:hypothetical protein
MVPEEAVRVEVVFWVVDVLERVADMIVLAAHRCLALLDDGQANHKPTPPRMEAVLVGAVALEISLVAVLGRRGVLVC